MQRPVFLNLLQIQMPVGALTSITHRITGVFLALNIPIAIWLLDMSLQGPQTFAQLQRLSAHWTFKVVAILSIWALAHHLLAGIRHLLSDIDIGSHLPAARHSAWVVNISGFVVAIVAAGALL